MPYSRTLLMIRTLEIEGPEEAVIAQLGQGLQPGSARLGLNGCVIRERERRSYYKTDAVDGPPAPYPGAVPTKGASPMTCPSCDTPMTCEFPYTTIRLYVCTTCGYSETVDTLTIRHRKKPPRTPTNPDPPPL